ncbi:src-like-adapter isoform X1 [Trichechus manatus latirostris]|uniref:Src-like-adapter n=3 Tax=Trichechus manatus latirostris TaxID=127582 RepID=A0A2Y9DEE1_TRIMA|nr:src-like-adapter isoform X1 [Trichechus manatus latirostris]
MHSKLGHSARRGLGAWLNFRVCLLCPRLPVAPTARRGEREMGNSMKSTPAPPERPQPSPEGLDTDFLAVLSDYPSPDISPPIFRRGEKLRVISDEGGWWKAISLSTGRENYIPGICVARVYHGWLFEGLGRDKAEELLQLPDTKMGSFMIRESETKKGFYSLSVRHRQVKHYRIFRLPNNWYYISPRLTFQCLEDLVNHYSEVADGLCCVLTTPCLTQSIATPAVQAPSSPVTLRQKTFNWKKASRLQEEPEGAGSTLGVDESLFSYGLRESIASYLSLTGDDNPSFSGRKKSVSVIYGENKRKSSFFSLPPYFED